MIKSTRLLLSRYSLYERRCDVHGKINQTFCAQFLAGSLAFYADDLPPEIKALIREEQSSLILMFRKHTAAIILTIQTEIF